MRPHQLLDDRFLGVDHRREIHHEARQNGLRDALRDMSIRAAGYKWAYRVDYLPILTLYRSSAGNCKKGYPISFVLLSKLRTI